MNLKEFRIYRWNPEDGENPRIDTYFSSTSTIVGPMVLDALIWIKNEGRLDADLPSFVPRRASAGPAR